MPEYDNTNSGVLFKNDRRTTERQPTHTGSLNVEGVDYWISAWVKDSKDGKRKFFSLAVTKKEDLRTVDPRAVPSPDLDESDDIPF